MVVFAALSASATASAAPTIEITRGTAEPVESVTTLGAVVTNGGTGPGTHLGPGAPVAIDISAGRPCVVPVVLAGASVRHVEHLVAKGRCGYTIVHAHSHRVRRGAVISLGSHAPHEALPRHACPSSPAAADGITRGG